MRDALWRRLARWLVAALARVLSGVERGLPPDPLALLAGDPLDVEPAVEAAHDAMRSEFARARRLPPDAAEVIEWSRGAQVEQALADLRNRLVGIPDQVFEDVRRGLAEGESLGEGIPELAERVRQVMSTAGASLWRGRAETIARTEIHQAMNAARYAGFLALAASEPRTVWEKRWVATDDPRTRPTHRAAAGQRVPLTGVFQVGQSLLRYPGDPLGEPQETISCRCTMSLLRAGEVL